MPFKDISYISLWLSFWSVERNYLGNFGRGHNEEHFCEIILNLDHWLRGEMLFKIFLIYSFGGHLVLAERNHLGNFG